MWGWGRVGNGEFKTRSVHIRWLAAVKGWKRRGMINSWAPTALLPVLLLASLLEKVVTVYSQETAELPFDRLVLAGIC